MTQKVRRRRPPGETKQVVMEYLADATEASVAEISAEVRRRLGPVPSSSIRGHLNANTPGLYERVRRGRYRVGRTSVIGRSASHWGSPTPTGDDSPTLPAPFPQARPPGVAGDAAPDALCSSERSFSMAASPLVAWRVDLRRPPGTPTGRPSLRSGRAVTAQPRSPPEP
jgi:hypothetical protein